MGLFGPPNVEKMKAKKDVKGLIKALGYQKDSSIRMKAAIALGQVSDARAVEPLIAALKENNYYMNEAAAQALVEIGAPAVEPLTAALNDEVYFVRRRAAKALGQIGDARAVEPLIAALKDKDKDVRLAAVEALGHINDPRAVEPLIAALKDLSWSGTYGQHVNQAATKVLVEIGAPAVEPLIAALKDRKWGVRQDAAKALGQIGDARAVEPLIAALKDTDEHVRQAAAKALDILHWQPAVEPLIAALKDKDANVRCQAAEILGLFGDTRAIEPLIARLKDKDREMRKTAAGSLVQIYRSDKIAPTHKQRILSQRTLITHTDYGGHHDLPSVCSFPHEDSRSPHTDQGIGVDFPL